MIKVVVETVAINCAKLQSNCQHQPTNTQLFYRPDVRSVTQPTVSKHCREKVSQSTDLFTPSSLGVFQPWL